MRAKELFGVLGGFAVGVLMMCIATWSTERTLLISDHFSPERVQVQVKLRENKKNYTFADFMGFPQDDPALIDYIRQKILHPPSKAKYNLTNPTMKHFSQHRQSVWLESQITKGMRNGFFIEVGAINGEHLSNSLYFERELGWTGLLIEPNANTFEELLSKNRKSYSVHSALSLVPSPTEIKLEYVGPKGEMTKLSQNNEGTAVMAFPLYSLLLALNVTEIDYFSLDIEGQELKVLRTLPWDKLKFKILGIEKLFTEEGVDKLIQFVQDQGYIFIGLRELDAWFLDPEFYKECPTITL